MSAIIQHSGMIFLTKGNDIVPIPMKNPLFSGNLESPSVKQAQELIADGYELAMADDEKANKLVKKFTQGFPTMNLEVSDDLGSKVAKAIKNLGGKVPGALGILDILGMKKEYEQLMEGTHPMSRVLAEAGLLGPEAQSSAQVFKEGGIIGEPVQTARIGSYMRSTGGGQRPTTVTQRTTSGGGSRTQRKTQTNIDKGNAARQLDNLVNKSRGDSNYRNRPNVYNVNEILDKSNPLNLSKKERDFILRAGLRKDGTLNSAGQARIAQRAGGFSRDGAFIGDNRTAYQRDLNNFRKASPINNQAYIERFPKTAAFESMLNKTAEGIIGLPGRIIKKVSDNYLDGVKNMVEKISGVDAKNIDIAKDKDTNIDTIVKNLQRNVEKKVDEEKDREIRTGLPGDLTEEIPVDDILNADLLEVEEDSPLRTDNVPGTFVPPDQRVPDPIRQTRTEEPGDETVADQPQFTPIRLDRTVGDEGLFDLTGSDREGETSAFDLDPDETYFDLNRGTVLDPIDQKIARANAARELFAPGFEETSSIEDFSKMITDEIAARQKGLPDIDVTQERRDLVNNPIEGQATAAGQGLVYADGSPIMEQGPTPLFDSDIDEEAILRAIEGKADGGQIFGNQNMSTFDKLKAIADGIADNK